jgi:hypothetical protein
VTASKVDLRQFVVIAWCVHPDLILTEKLLITPELDKAHMLRSIFYNNHPALSYRVEIDILEVVEWNLPSDSPPTVVQTTVRRGYQVLN